ncbi:MAG: glycerol-3-phosphate 1-O-acyltransferase PlsY [Verrucomicrobiia bacterium]
MLAAFDNAGLTPWVWLAPLLCFWVGAIPFGYLIGRGRGVDLRQQGSGNIGATNAFRVLGPVWGTLVFGFDFAKGFLPIWWLGHLEPFHQAWTGLGSSDAGLLLCALLIVLGHNYTPFLGFRGGKGIASSAGLLLALMPVAFGLTAAVWGLVFGITRIVSVASLAASAILPVWAWMTAPDRPLLIGLCVLLAIVSFWRHRSNLARLLDGTEPSFRKKRTATSGGEAS